MPFPSQICDECGQGKIYGQADGRTNRRTDGRTQVTTISLWAEMQWVKTVYILCVIYHKIYWCQTTTKGPVLYIWLTEVPANGIKCYICNVFSHWLKPYSAIDGRIHDVLYGIKKKYRRKYYKYVNCAENTLKKKYHAHQCLNMSV